MALTFAEWMQRSKSPLRVLVEIDGYDGAFTGRYTWGNGFTPVDSGPTFYDGRLVEPPTVSIKRDSNFFGILVYSSAGVQLHNGDGALDTLGQSNVIQGGDFRVKVGFDDIQLSTYTTIFTGYVESFDVGEDYVTVTVADLRKRLGQKNYVSRLQYNAVTFIQDILTETYGITYDSTYFDTTAWAAAKALAPLVSRYHPEDDTVDKAISEIVASTFGFFFIDGQGRYSYRMIDTSATSVTTIQHADIMGRHSIAYDTSQVLASVRSRTPEWGDWGSGAQTSATSQSVVAMLDLTTHQLIGTWPTGSVFSSDEEGTSWSLISQLGTETAVFSLASLGSNKVLAGTSPAGFIYRSLDGGSTWTSIGRLAVTETSVYSIAHVGSGIAVAGTDTGRLFRSLDYGSTWSAMYQVTGYNIYCVASPGSGVVLAGAAQSPSASKLYRSLDSGSSWSLVQTLSSTYSVYAFCAVSSGNVLVTTGSGNGAVYRSVDSGSSWSHYSDLSTGGGNNDGYCINAADSVVLVGGNGSVYRSLDGGSSWSVMKRLASETTIRSITILDDGTILAGTYPSGLVFRSQFGEDTWTEDLTHQASVFSAYGIDANRDFQTCFALDTTGPATFSAAVLDYFKDSHGKFAVQVPIKYYTLTVGDTVDVEVKRNADTDMLGTVKTEVLGIGWNLGDLAMGFDLRIV